MSDIIRPDDDEVIEEQETPDEWEEVPIVDEPDDDEGEDQLIKEWDEEE
jgi:hypothetical protein